MSALPETLRNLARPREDAELIAYCNKLFQQAKKERLHFEKQWWLNLAFYFGRQWVQWAGVKGSGLTDYARLVEPSVPHWRVRLVINKIRPIIRAEISKLTAERPQSFVIPASNEDDDLLAARAAEHISEHLWRDLKVNRTLRQCLFWSCVTGTGFIKDWFDPNAVDSSGIKGKISIERVSPFHLLVPEPQEEELENQPYVIHILAKPSEWVQERYGVNVPPESSSGPAVLEQKFLSAMGLKSTGQAPNKVTVKEAWIKPEKRFPQGAKITWAGESILDRSEGWPFAHNEYPFTDIKHIPTGLFYGESVITDLVPVAKEYNRTRSQLVENKNRMSKPQLMAARGSVNPNRITSEPGLLIEYTPGFPPPTPLQLQDIPGYVTQELERLQRDFDDISAQHEISRGQVPPQVTAATAIGFLQEQDDTKLAHTVANVEEGVERLGRHFLSHVHQFWSAERVVRVAGENRSWESYVYKGSDIRGNTTFVVEAGSATPRSRAAKQAFITELGKMGWIPPDRALKRLDMAEVAGLYEEMHVDHRQVQRENMRMMAGEPVVPNTWDNHIIHREEHDNFRKRQIFEDADDQIKMIFEQHVAMHRQAEMAMAFQQQMGGTNGPQTQVPAPNGGNPQAGAGLSQ